MSRRFRSPEPEQPRLLPVAAQPALAELLSLDADCFDPLTVAALLESRGLRDSDAQERFGQPDVFALGEQLYEHMATPGPPLAPRQETSDESALARALSHIGAGLALGILAASQLLLFVGTGYSLWAWEGYTTSEATVMALAVIGSLLVSALGVHALGRRGTYYRYVKNRYLLYKEVQRLTALGIGFVVVAALAVELPLLLFGGTGFGRGFGFYLLLTVFWLVAARLTLCRLHWLMAPVGLAGVVAIVLLRDRFGWPVPSLQAAVLALVDVVLLAISELRLRRLVRQASESQRLTRLLPLPALLVRVWPACLYGVTYYLVLFADRLVNWTAQPLPAGAWISFRASYEAGHDVALLVLFIGIAVLEHTTHVFSESFLRYASQAAGQDDFSFARATMRLYVRQAVLLIAVLVVALAAGFGLVRGLSAWGHDGSVQIFREPAVQRDYLLAGAGYVCLAAALYSGVFLQSLSRQIVLARWLLTAAIVDLVVGGAAVTAFGQEWAVLGLIAGALTAAGFSAVYSLLTFRRGAYYLAASLA